MTEKPISKTSPLAIKAYGADGKLLASSLEEVGFWLDDAEVRRMAEGIKAKDPRYMRIVIWEDGKKRFDSKDLLG